MTPVADFDPTTPSIARVYDYLLNGKDNFAVDREVADKLLAVAPIAALVMRENRQFLARAASWAAGQGIGQFIDLGCGMPTTPNTHQSAQAVVGDAQVAYVDTDAVVLAHLRALAAQGNPGVTVIDGDVREVEVILDAISPAIDLSRPVCLLMGALLHFFPPMRPETWWPATWPRSRPAAMSCSRSAALTETPRPRGSAPTPRPARRRRTTTRWPSSRASSARCHWCRRAWPTPANGIRTTSSRPRCRPVPASHSSASRASERGLRNRSAGRE